MTDVLRRICADTLSEVRTRKARRPIGAVEADARAADPPRGFAAALGRARSAGRYGLIGEVKKASPSRGLIRADFDPPALARAYAAGGATCLSVLTDGPYFQGEDGFLTAARDACTLPVLRKDFMLDPYQIAEARAIGADCVLLIMAALDDATVAELAAAADAFGLDTLIEVHDAAELERALALAPADALIGINNRDLKSLAVDLSTTERLAPVAGPDRLVVGESGLSAPPDLARLAAVGVTTFLVGESLMRQADVAAATEALLTPPGPPASARTDGSARAPA